MTFASPLFLATLVVPVLALLGYLWFERRPPRSGGVAFPNLSVLASVSHRSSWRRHVVAALLLGTLALLCVAVARPKVALSATSREATVVLVVDVSVSMYSTDVPPSRFAAARSAIADFIRRAPRNVKIGVVAFADEPVVIAAPTTDKKALLAGIGTMTPGYGTAIGDAVARAVALVRSPAGSGSAKSGSGRPPGAVVLLSDGSQTRGLLGPADGARLARQAGIPVYTIALGTPNGTVVVNRGGEQIVVPVPPDRKTLAQIAEATGATTFEATDAGGLGAVYRRLGHVVASTAKRREVSSAFVAAAAALLTGGIALAGLWAPRLP
jgi:Ca-activated chloride channel family protein